MLLHTNDAVTSQNWVITKVDTEVLPAQCYHVEIQWLVCRSSLVDDLITAMGRRAKQLGLELQKITENGISSNLDLHPLNCPLFIKIRDPVEQRLVEKALVDRFDFCCEALHPIPFVHLNHNEEYAIVRQEPRLPRARRVISYYRQYVHRSLACFARLTQTGLVWISNQKVHDDEIQPIFDGLCQYIESLQVARSTLISVLDDAFSATAAEMTVVAAKKSNPKSDENYPSEDSSGVSNNQSACSVSDSSNASASTSSCSEEEKENAVAATVARSVDPSTVDTMTKAGAKWVAAASAERLAGPDVAAVPPPLPIEGHEALPEPLVIPRSEAAAAGGAN